MGNLWWLGYSLSLVFWILSLYVHKDFFSPAMVLFFTTFDLLVFNNFVKASSDYLPYRFAQGGVQVIIMWLLFVTVGFYGTLSFFVFWWLGGCDVLYYLLGRFEFDEQWFWVSWTPLGAYHSLVRQEPYLSRAQVLGQAFVGLLFSATLLVIF